MDHINLEIIRLLQNGRRSHKDIATELNLSEATIRSRVGKMVQEGFIQIKALVNPKCMPDGYELAYVCVRLNTPLLMDTARELRTLPGVISVAVVTGRYDIILTVMLRSGYKLIDFYNEMLSRHSTVIKSNETFMVYEDIDMCTPFPF